MSPLSVLLTLIVLALAPVQLIAATCQSYDGVSPSPALWSALYGTAAIVGPLHITVPVVLDVTATSVSGGVYINQTGALYVQDGNGHGQLITDFISVEGLLQVGSSSCPFTSSFTFQLQGLTPMPYLMHATATPMLKAIVIWTGGELELHGSKGLTAPHGNGVSWTRLEGTLAVGATSMKLNQSVTELGSGGIFDWQVGDRVLVTGTDYDPYQSETVTITGFTGTDTVTFTPPLVYSHFGAWTYGSDQRASIGLLTRNILITTQVERWANTSDPITAPGTLGTHVMMMQGFNASHVEGIAIVNGGQGDFQARYPFHWHLCGPVNDSYLRASTIENSLFRAVTIHGTQYARVEEVVAYNISGHCWFLEDGAEWGNILNHNLGALVRLKTTGFYLGSDIATFGLSTYWLTNPNNTFTNNIAAGSEGTGVWWELRGLVEGPSYSTGLYNGYQPYRAPQGPMTGNIWHSMIHGANMEGGGFDPNDNVPWPNPVQLHQNLAGIQPPLDSNGGRQVVIDNHWWKISQEGFWAREFQVDVINSSFADCGGDALQIAGSGGHPTQRGAGRIINTRFIGLSENRGNQHTPTVNANGENGPYQSWVVDQTLGGFSLPSQASLVGYRIYDGPVHVINCVFEQYLDFHLTNGARIYNYAIAPRNGNSFFMQSLTSIESTVFINVTTRFQSIDPSVQLSGWSDGSKNTVIYDIDGSISGHPYYYCLPHGFGYYNSGPGCVTNALYDMCCPQQYFTSQILCLDREAWNNYAGLPACPPVNIMHQIRLDVDNDDLSVNSSNYDLPMNNGNEQWNTLWATNSSYLIYFDQYTPSFTGFQIANTYRGDWINFAFCLPQNATVVEVLRGRALAAYGVSPTWAIYSASSPIQAVSSFEAFQSIGPSIEWPYVGGYYYYDTERNMVHVHVQSRSYRMWGSGDVNSDYCGLHGCDFLIVHSTGSNSGVTDCTARAFSSAYTNGDLQIRSGSDFFRDYAPGPRVNGPIQRTTCPGCLFIDAAADQFYEQNNAPQSGDTDFVDDRGIYWASDDGFNFATDTAYGFAAAFDHHVNGDLWNQGYMYQSVATGDFQYRFNVSGKDTYVVSIYLNEVYWTAPNKRVFNILVNGVAVFKSIDIFALAGSSNYAVQQHCFVNLTTADSTPVITLVSQSVTDNPVISGISILPYSSFVTVFPEAANEILPGTAANAPPISSAPPTNNGGGNNNGNGGGGTTTTPNLPVPSGWIWISATNTSYVSGGGTSTLGSNVVISPSPQGAPLNSWESAQPQLFRSNRYGTMTYTIPVPQPGAWTLRLLFAENYWSTIGSRIFSVQVQGQTVLSNLDLNTVGANASVPATSGTTANLAATTAFVYEQNLTISSTLTINFVRQSDNPLVCGIVIIPNYQPAVSLSSTSSPAVPVSSSASVATGSSTGGSSSIVVSSTARVAITPSSSSTVAASFSSSTVATSTPSSTGFALRINSGSSTSTSVNDVVWQADEYWVATSATYLLWNGAATQTYANTTAAMDPIYNSNRYNADSVKYVIPVTQAGQYQLTLYYAEIYWTSAGQRLFSVTVQDVLALPSLDIFAASGGKFAAFQTVHNVNVTAASLNVTFVLKSIRDNALLCGIELLSL